MDDENGTSNLPARIVDALASVPQAMVPGTGKALLRLLGAAIGVPVAWLDQRKAMINSQTESYKLVESAIAQKVAADAAADPETTRRAMAVLVRKEYRKQINREAVAVAMVEDMREHASNPDSVNAEVPGTELDEDWLNVFDRYAEDASSERLQGLWGRVLAGEIRGPGRFSTRTLRFLSEFSQADALTFEVFAKSAFGNAAPKSLVVPPERGDIRDLVYLEANGLIQGASGAGLTRTLIFNADGISGISEGDLYILFKGDPNARITHDVIALTPLGQELLGLVTSRNQREAARAVAFAIRTAQIHEAYLTVREAGETRHTEEVLWLKEVPASPVVEVG